MTIQEYFNKIRDTKIRNRVFELTDKEDLKGEVISMRAAFSSAFVWSWTEEGKNYWEHVSNRIDNEGNLH